MPSRRPDEKDIGERLEFGDLFEYLAREPSVEAKDFETDHQGVALAYQTKVSRATKLGTYFEGAHVAATDFNLERYFAGDEGLGPRLHVYHRCAEWLCRAKTDRKAELVHCPKWRLMEASVAGDLPYVGDAVSVLIASRLEVESDAEEPDGGAISNDEAEALGELDASSGKPDAKKPRTANVPAGGKESRDHFTRHLGPSHGSNSEQVTSDAKLAAQLADSDVSARAAGAKHGVSPVGGLGGSLPSVEVHPRQDGTAGHGFGKGLVPKIGQRASEDCRARR